MSKREFKKYISGLSKEQLEEQLIDVYGRFKEVKEYYDFAFNPKEDKLIDECKFKIGKEYFPVNRRKAKMRRSVAQNYIRHFKRLGVESSLIADVMLYNVEIAQTYCKEKYVRQDSFYTSMLKSFDEAVSYIIENSLQNEFNDRVQKIAEEAWEQQWINKEGFDRIVGKINYS
ncbi:hypothetical protein EYV94_11340 [Puteibacter caeruleilacunae]|nr:hypothetical protein EYV94_11340 [Puteibacter caeruleilacunae]